MRGLRIIARPTRTTVLVTEPLSIEKDDLALYINYNSSEAF